jgi:hypothetical protein
MENQPAIITLTGDNALTIGVMGGVLYLGALLLAQLYMRAMAGMSKTSN